MHQALTTEGDQVRLRHTPVGQRRRPLLRAAHIKDPLARHDHTAVDDPDHNRRHLAGRDGDHDLVQQRHALRDLAQPGQGLTPAELSERHQVPVAEALADLLSLAEAGVRGRGVAHGKALEGGRHEQIPLLHTVQVSFVQQATGPGDPAATAGRLAPAEEAEGQPERAPDRSLHAAPAQPLVMGARPGIGAVVVPPDQVRRRGQPLQVLDLQRGFPVGGRQLRERIRPCPAPERLPAPIQRIGRRHPPSPRQGGHTRVEPVTRSPAPSPGTLPALPAKWKQAR